MDVYPYIVDWEKIQSQVKQGLPITGQLVSQYMQPASTETSSCGSESCSLSDALLDMQKQLSPAACGSLGALISCICLLDIPGWPRPTIANWMLEMIVVYPPEVTRTVHETFLLYAWDALQADVQRAWELMPNAPWKRYWSGSQEFCDYLQQWHSAIAEAAEQSAAFALNCE